MSLTKPASLYWYSLSLNVLILLISFRFVLDIYKAEGRLETKDSIYGIPLLVPEVTINAFSLINFHLNPSLVFASRKIRKGKNKK